MGVSAAWAKAAEFELLIHMFEDTNGECGQNIVHPLSTEALFHQLVDGGENLRHRRTWALEAISEFQIKALPTFRAQKGHFGRAELPVLRLKLIRSLFAHDRFLSFEVRSIVRAARKRHRLMV